MIEPQTFLAFLKYAMADETKTQLRQYLCRAYLDFAAEQNSPSPDCKEFLEEFNTALKELVNIARQSDSKYAERLPINHPQLGE